MTHAAHSNFDFDYLPDALEVQVSELVVATADHCDPMIDDAVSKVLKILREQHGTHAAFASEFIDGRRVQRTLAGPVGGCFLDDRDSDPLDFAFCRQIVPGAASAARYISVPVVLADGRLYGMLYGACPGHSEEVRQRDLKHLEMTAQLAARLIDARRMRPPGAAAVRPIAEPQFA
jgi:GAF domain-containing protein